MSNTNDYKDIINLPHHISSTRPQMPMKDRAAQFSPFAALNGYDDAIKETGRLTDQKLELDEEAIALLDRKHAYLSEHISEHPTLSVTYFLHDSKKSGGKYVSVVGKLKQFDEYARLLIFTDGKKIPMYDIAYIEGEIFRGVFPI